MLFQILYKSSDSTCLLTDCDINTIYRLSCLIERLLVNNSINSNSCLTRLTVANDELTLATVPSPADGISHLEPYGQEAFRMS